MTRLLARTCAAAIAAAMPMAALAEIPRITVGLSVSPTSMDPQLGALGSDEAYYRHIYDPLILSDGNLQPTSALATSWELIDDLTWELKLREGVTFHDGSAFDAGDVTFTLDRLPTVPGSDGLNAEKMAAIERVEVLDPHTIRLHTKVPTPDLLTLLYTAFIISDELDPAVTTEDFNSGAAAIGTGPYAFGAWDRGTALTLEANADYWGGAPAAKTAVLREIPEDAARVAALLAGDVDLIDAVPPLDVARLRVDPEVEIVDGPSARTIFLQFNTEMAPGPMLTAKDGTPLETNPLKDARVREALSLAISRELIGDRIMEGLSTPITQGVPNGFLGADETIPAPAYDPERARALLAEAGYPDGFAMTLACPNDRYVNDAAICQAAGQMLAAIGIDANVETMPKGVYFTRMRAGEFPMFMLGWGNAQGNSGSMLRAVLVTKDEAGGFGSWNGGFSDPAADAQLVQAEQIMDVAMRDEELAKASRMFMDAHAIVPLHAQNVIMGLREGLGYTTMPDEAFRAANVTE
jgi:peptide/nickel transport system substrate-binding protein